MGGGFHAPVSADGVGGDFGGERSVGQIVGGLGGMAEGSGRGAEGEDVALDPDDGFDVIFPAGIGEPVAWLEDRDGAAFDAVAPLVVAAGCAEQGGGRANILRVRKQSGLVVFDLDDQGDVCGAGDVEEFF
jgi:hypothetical protein